jgi:uncharacterized protein
MDDGLTASTFQPTPISERILILDVLRGIALFGVLTANIWLWFSGVRFLFPGVLSELGRMSLDSVAFIFISTFISGKAIRTFSLLFGLGFALQMMRAEARGKGITSLYSRRLIVLLAFGIVHAVFFWYGDILMTYALLGFGLLLFRRRTQLTLIVWAVMLIVVIPISIASVPLIRSLIAAGPALPGSPGTAEQNQTVLMLFASGRPAEIVKGNLLMLRHMYLTPKAIGHVNLFGFFLLGLYAGRARIFENLARHRKQLRGVALWGFPVGLTFALVEGWLRMTFGARQADLPWFPLALSATITVSTAPFALAYIAAATLLLDKPRWRRVLSAFAPVGRMALTNYLTQTLMCLAIFYAGGLFGSFRPALGLLIAIMIFTVQMAYSAWWLDRYRFGPAEWLWRSLTYGRMQPIRIQTAPAPTLVAG